MTASCPSPETEIVLRPLRHETIDVPRAQGPGSDTVSFEVYEGPTGSPVVMVDLLVFHVMAEQIADARLERRLAPHETTTPTP